MITAKTPLAALPAAALLALACAHPAAAQATDAKAAQSQVSWTLADLDPLLIEQNQIADDADDFDRFQSQIRNSEQMISYDITNFNSHCTGGRWANPCNGWQQKINTWQAGHDRDVEEMNRRYEALTQRSRNVESRIEQMRLRLMDNVGQLLNACRAISPAERGNFCSIPGTGRYTGKFIEQARSRLRSGL